MAKKRKRKGRPPHPYRSWLEHDLHKGCMRQHEHEPPWSHMKYVIEKVYKPDFASYDDPTVVYEAKGFFRTHDEAKKYVWVKKSHPHMEIRFIIGDPNKRAYPQTKMRMGDWLTKQGFEWCTADSVPAEWRVPSTPQVLNSQSKGD